MNMNPQWLVRLNTYLHLINPLLCLVAIALALTVIVAAGEHPPIGKTAQAIPVVESINVPLTATCPKTAISPELRDMLLHD